MKTINTIIITLMIVTAISYTVITVHELIDQDPDDNGEEILFGVAVILYLVVAYWMIKTTSLIPIIITIVGNAGLVVLYIIAETEFGDFGITVKIFQIMMIILLIMQIKTNNK